MKLQLILTITLQFGGQGHVRKYRPYIKALNVWQPKKYAWDLP